MSMPNGKLGKLRKLEKAGKLVWGLQTDLKQGMITKSNDFSQKMKGSRGVILDMKKKLICAGLMSLTMAALDACSNAETSEAESTAPETYNANMTSVENSADSEYEIDDMLPRLSDDTFVISVEEAEAFMNKNVDANNDAE